MTYDADDNARASYDLAIAELRKRLLARREKQRAGTDHVKALAGKAGAATLRRYHAKKRGAAINRGRENSADEQAQIDEFCASHDVRKAES